MPAHVEHARRLAAEVGAGNARFHAADFATAVDLDLPPFDYVVAHGVYSWVDTRAQRALRRFVDRHLKPGGLLFVSYNAMPGRADDVPFQRLAHALGQAFAGDSVERYSAASAVIGKLADARVPAITWSSALRQVTDSPGSYPPAYLAHEYLVAAWQPLWATEVRAAMAEIGLTSVGSATLIENFDAFVLGQKARDLLAGFEDDDLQEMLRDFFISQRFRRDVFIRDGQRLDDDEQRRRLLSSTFALSCPPGEVTYATATPAGKLRFDNSVARAVVAALSGGPRAPREMVAPGVGEQDVLANVLTLCAGDVARPVEGRTAPVSAVNTAILQHLDGPDELRCLALPCGTALSLDRAVLAALKGGGSVDDPKVATWLELLEIYDIRAKQGSA